VNSTIRFYRRLLNYAMLAMGLLFINSIWAQLPHVPLDTLDSFLLLRCTFVFYVYCWYWGCNRDLDVQNDILLKAPNPTTGSIGVAIMIFVLFAFLFLVHNPLLLSVLFLVFLTANIAWKIRERTVSNAEGPQWVVGASLVRSNISTGRPLVPFPA
jgi:hypothetical protein